MAREGRRIPLGKGTLAVAACLVAVGLGTAALAWACTPQAEINVSPQTATPGQQVTLSGAGFVPGAAISITWDGASVATATGPAFSTSFTVPRDAAPRVHIINATSSPDPEGRAWKASTAVEVLAPPSAAAPPRTAPPAPSVQAPDRAATGERNRTPERAGGDRSTAPRGTAPAQIRTDALPSDSGGQRVFPGSVPRERSEPARSSAGRAAASPSERSAASSLWGGFDGERSPLSEAGAAKTTSPPGSQLVVGSVLLGLALLSLVAGLGAVGSRARARNRA